MKKNVVRILTAVLMLSVVFSSSVFAAEKQKSAWESFVGLFTGNAVTVADTQVDGVTYQTHIQNDGWKQGWVSDGEMSGSEGRGLRLEGIEIEIEGDELPDGLGITYRTHIENDGWKQGWVSDGEMSGSEGRGLRLEGIEIMLTGENADDYTVLYRTHIQNDGWKQGWVADGEMSGSEGRGLRLEGIEIKIEQVEADLTAYEAALAAVEEADYTEASWATYEAIVAENVVTADNKQSEVDAATEAILDAQADLVTVPVISAVTATAQKTLTVTGTELSKLATSMFTVAGNTVTAVTPNADGTSATLTLGTDLAPETNVKVTATIDGTATDYTVKYTVAATTVAVQAGTYDDDRAGQVLSVLVNGIATTPDYLITDGYTVTFTAWKDGALTTDLFNGSTTSTTGKLVMVPTTVINKDYTVAVTIAKGSTIASSEAAAIKIRDLDNNANAISSTTLKRVTSAGNASVTSSTLVLNETAYFSKVVVGYGDAAAELVGTPTGAPFNVTSSNAGVISVNSSTKLMTAVGIGTADITITVGNTTKVVTLTVTGAPRAATTVTPASSTLTVLSSATNSVMTVVVKDQFGDPFVESANASKMTFTIPTITDMPLATPPLTNGVYTTGLAVTSTTVDGKLDVGFTGGLALEADKTGVVVFKNNKGAVIGSFNVVTSNNNQGTIKKLIYSAGSTDDTLNTDLTSDSSVTFKVGNYNTSGNLVAELPLAGFKVIYNGDIVTVASVGGTDNTVNSVGSSTKTTTLGTATEFKITGSTAGTTSVQIVDLLNKPVETRTIVVTKGVPYISNVTFKPIATYASVGTLNYKSVLTVEESTGVIDDIVNNVTLTPTSVFKVRLTKAQVTIGTTVHPKGTFYLDKTDTGTVGALDVTDQVLGTLSMTYTPDGGVIDNTLNPIDGKLFATGNKGVLAFYVNDTASSTPQVRASKSITINVPKTDNQILFESSQVVGLTATDTLGATNNGKVDVAWTALAGATGYTVSYTTGTTTLTQAAATNSATLSGLTAGTPYTINVVASNGTVSSIVSANVTGTAVDYIAAVPAAPAVKTADAAASLTASYTGVTAITLNTAPVALTNTKLLDGSGTAIANTGIIATELEKDIDAVFTGTSGAGNGNSTETFSVTVGTGANAGKLIITSTSTGSTATVSLVGSTPGNGATALGFTTLTAVNGTNLVPAAN